MRIIFHTNETFDSSEKFRYMFANVAASFPDVHVVAVRRSRAEQVPFLPRLQERARKVLWRVRRFGFLHTLEVLTSLPLQLFIGQRNWEEVDERLQQLCRPAVELRPEKAVYVETIDGPETVEAISRLQPDVVIQEAAGILRRQVFEVAHIGTRPARNRIGRIGRKVALVVSASGPSATHRTRKALEGGGNLLTLRAY